MSASIALQARTTCLTTQRSYHTTLPYRDLMCTLSCLRSLEEVHYPFQTGNQQSLCDAQRVVHCTAEITSLAPHRAWVRQRRRNAAMLTRESWQSVCLHRRARRSARQSSPRRAEDCSQAPCSLPTCAQTQPALCLITDMLACW